MSYPGEAPESLNLEMEAPAEPQTAPMIPPQDQLQQQGQEQVISSLRLENQLLRNEVSSLNQEMASLIQRAKEMQEGETKTISNLSVEVLIELNCAFVI